MEIMYVFIKAELKKTDTRKNEHVAAASKHIWNWEFFHLNHILDILLFIVFHE